jgi:phosphate:Na+ symporter
VAVRLMFKGRVASLGMAIAGFGLIFVGIDYMQQGMSSLQSMVTPGVFPADTISGRLQLVVIGILITIVTQSSSAGVAAALTAVYTGTINFEQAAALVIGMDVGTTVTAALATIGGSAGSRRTGFSHVIYNLMTAAGALLFVTPYTMAWEAWAPGQLNQNAEIALVGFHTTFNTLGVILVLPFTRQFADFMQNLITDQSNAYTQSLDRRLLSEPDIALTAAQASIHSELLALLRHLKGTLDTQYKNQLVSLAELKSALDETHAYVDLIHLEKEKTAGWTVLMSVIHSLDHMQRLHERCEEDTDRAVAATHTPELVEYIQMVSRHLDGIISDIDANLWDQAVEKARQAAEVMSADASEIRTKIMSRVGTGEISMLVGTDCLEGIRWLRRVTAHMLRITHHQAIAQQLLAKKSQSWNK